MLRLNWSGDQESETNTLEGGGDNSGFSGEAVVH